MIATAFLVYGVNGFYRLVIIISSKDILFQIAAPFRKSFNFSLSPNINHFFKKSNLWLKRRVVIRLGVKSFSCLRFIWQGQRGKNETRFKYSKKANCLSDLIVHKIPCFRQMCICFINFNLRIPLRCFFHVRC